MSEKYKLSILALTACLLTGCGAGETIVLENTTAELPVCTGISDRQMVRQR